MAVNLSKERKKDQPLYAIIAAVLMLTAAIIILAKTADIQQGAVQVTGLQNQTSTTVTGELNKELSTTVDDGGISEVDGLARDANGL